MKIKKFAILIAATAAFFVGVQSANADMPLDVDCELLMDTNDAINDFLDGEGIQFANLGQLFSASILDPGVFNQLNALVQIFSFILSDYDPEAEISFDSTSQVVSTNARCGLIPQLIDNVRN